MSQLKIYFCADVHGSEIVFSKFLNAGKFYKTDIMMLSGDITGKMVIPIIRQGDGSYRSEFMGKKYNLKNESEVRKLEEGVGNSGYYSYLTSEEELKELGDNKAKAQEIFSRLMTERLRKWIRLAEERLRGMNVKCYVMPGNDDELIVDQILEESTVVLNPEGKILEIAGYEMISTGFGNITPWHCPRDIPEEQLGKKIEEMTSQVKDMKKAIFNFHVPPYGSQLDTAPEIDADLKPVVYRGEMKMIPVGSKAVRSAIERHQPLLGLHGHIHESRGTFNIGRTLCINPGSEYSEGILRGAFVGLRNESADYLLTSG